jgi:hypothetical protein
VLLVAGGCVLGPRQPFKDVSLQRYVTRTSLWMVLAALGTVGYTLLDKTAAETVQSGPATAARYGYVYFTVSFIPYTFLLNKFKTRLPSSAPVSSASGATWKLAIPAAFLSFGAYWLILWAYQLSPYASYIVAFRQFSIVIGAIMAFILYKEKGSPCACRRFPNHLWPAPHRRLGAIKKQVKHCERAAKPRPRSVL